MKSVLAIDPGSSQSAYVVWNGERVFADTLTNADMLEFITNNIHLSILVVERIESYGMAVGVTTFDTVLWSGRFIQRWLDAPPTWTAQEPSASRKFAQLGRRDVKLHLCGSARAKDANIRQALIDRFGPGKDKAIGTKKAQGPLYGIKSHQWAALAVAVTFWDRRDWDKSIADVKAQTEAF